MLVVVLLPSGDLMWMVPWPRIAADADLTFNNPTAEAVQAVTEVAQNGETTLPDGTIVPIPDNSEIKLVNKQMQDVCDDPANKWVLTIPHAYLPFSSLRPVNQSRGRYLGARLFFRITAT